MATPISTNRAALDASIVAAATGGVIRMHRGRPARGVTTDSRAVVPGGAFVALRGEHHDGHDYLAPALEAGAVLLVVEAGRAPADDRADVVEVPDTLSAWGAIARAHLARWRATGTDRRVVGITGSAGKTTTKELCAALLGAVAPCLATAGNLNNRIGLPSVALRVEDERFVVLEMGMSLRGEIAALASIAQPDAGVVLNVGMAHAGGVGGTLDDVADEKGALFAALAPGAVAVANADDPAVMSRAARTNGVAIVRFGRSSDAEVRLVSREVEPGGGSHVVVERAGRRASFVVPIPGEAAALDFVAALAASEAVAGPMSDDLVATVLATVRPIAGRMNVLRANGLTVIDDAYNANPASVRAALGALGEMPAHRRVAVLGEMRELGPQALAEHEALADAVLDAHVDVIVSCGGMVDALARAVAARGVETAIARDAAEAAATARVLARPGDVVLVKASRSVGAEQVVTALVGDGASR